MKKNIAARIAAFLFILTMISTCAFATTFAKYTTSGSATDEARVAKWGVTIAVTGNDAFSPFYDSEQNPTVKASTTTNVVAPGTSGDLASVSVSGSPEVSSKVSIDVSLSLKNWYISYKDAEGNDVEEFYCPIIITIVKNDDVAKKTTIKGTDYTSAHDFQVAVDAALDKETTYNPNDSLAQKIEISWAWEFAGAADSKQTNEKDTLLGDRKTAPTITLSAACTVEQIN